MSACEVEISNIYAHIALTEMKHVTIPLQYWNVYVKEADPEETWYYLENIFWAYPPNTSIDFALKYKGTIPGGNCTWSFYSIGKLFLICLFIYLFIYLYLFIESYVRFFFLLFGCSLVRRLVG